MTEEEFNELLEAALRKNISWCKGVKSVERLSGGASQETYRIVVEGESKTPRLIALRRAPGGVKSDAAIGPGPGLGVEAKLMQLAALAGVPEPEVYYIFRPEDGLGEGFAMEWIEGEALGAKITRSKDLEELRKTLAYKCGEILARIHSVNLDSTGLREDLETFTPEELINNSWERYKGFGTPQPMIDYAARWLLDNVPILHKEALVHNDFRNGNFMVNQDSITAVLDWEVAHIGDPMRDLGWICTNSWRFGRSDLPVGGFGSYEDLIRGYEEQSGQSIDLASIKYWEVMGSFWWAVGCLGMVEHYREGPDQTVERPGIGRRSSECQIDCVNLLIPGPVELVEGADLDDSHEMPRINELLASVTDFLRGDIMSATEGRTNFLARVASNSLDIVSRDLSLGNRARANELQRLREYFSSKGSLDELRWNLVDGLRDGTVPLNDKELNDHLRQTVVNQVAIDQPRYSGFNIALAGSYDD